MKCDIQFLSLFKSLIEDPKEVNETSSVHRLHRSLYLSRDLNDYDNYRLLLLLFLYQIHFTDNVDCVVTFLVSDQR